jgi:endoglucanase
MKNIKRIQWTVTFFVCTIFSAFATSQYPDNIIYEGKEYIIHRYPMDEYFLKHPRKKPSPNVMSTALHRGYVATFEISNKTLVLKDIFMQEWNEEHDDSYWKSVKDEVNPEGKNLIIDWFTGILVLPNGKKVEGVYSGYGPSFSNYILLEIKKGKLSGNRNYNLKEFEKFRKRQFDAFRNSEKYKKKVEEMKKKKWTEKDINSFIQTHITKFSSKFLDKDKKENSSEKEIKKDAFYWNKLIGRGVNLGNALETPKEVNWGVTLEESYFDVIKEAGFNSVRIPVRWSAHADDKPPYAIDENFFERVDWAVKQALSRKLVAIINIHHYKEIVENPQKHKGRFLELWKQIAEHYSDYPPELYFEIMNEPCKNLNAELWNEYLLEGFNMIRKSNPERAVIIGPADWNNISQFQYLKLPENDNNIIATFHFYEPFKFTHQGASWVGEQSKEWLGTKWTGSDMEKRELSSKLDEAVKWAEKNKVPLYMGEFGAYSKADMQSRAKWTSFVRKEAEKRDISWTYWEFCSGFGVYDKNKKKWRKELLRALLNLN